MIFMRLEGFINAEENNRPYRQIARAGIKTDGLPAPKPVLMTKGEHMSDTNQSNVAETANLYASEAGARYYLRREELRSDEVQRHRALWFQDIADENAAILDFGSGNGGLLSELKAAKRIGVEISPYAADDARAKLDLVVPDLSRIDDQSVDVAISFHALEHVMQPVSIVQGMYRVLKPGGQVRIVVPCDMPLLSRQLRQWRPSDPDMHLHGWSPLTLGNLLTVCGFEVERTKIVPGSGGGRLGRMLPPGNWLRTILVHRKALINGRYGTVITGRKRG
jgi:SAM-dependent methyltransferase